MNFNTLLKIAPNLVAGGKTHLIESAPGRGKSEVIEQIYEIVSAREPGQWQFIDIFPATMTPPDMMGYMVPENVDGKIISAFSMPPWMVTRENKPIDPNKKVFLFIDEYDKADVDVKKICAELMLKKRIGNHYLPEGSSVWAAANRAQDRSGSTKDFDFVINRRSTLRITDDLNSWKRWAMANNVRPEIQTFVEQNPEVVFSDGVPEKQGPWCTPRSIILCQEDLLALAGGHDQPIPVTPEAKEIAASWIGEAACSQLFALLQLALEMPDLKDILRDPEGTRVPDDLGAKMLITYRLSHQATEKTIEPIVTYVERLAKDFSITFAEAACRRDPDLIDTETITNWCQKNGSLMAAIQQINA